MVNAKIKEASKLRRKAVVPDADRTPARDEAADWIEDNVVNNDRWHSVTITEIADGAGFSREHISNVLDRYFEPQSQQADDLTLLLGNDVPSEQSAEYRQGFADGFRQALNLPDTVLRKFIDD